MSYIILIGGGSASGKTYVSQKLIERLGKEKVTRISIDDYYKDLSDLSMAERNKINYDSPKAFDFALLEEHLKELKAGRGVDKPIYDFTVHNRSHQTEHLKPSPIIIVEGIMALVKDKIRKEGDVRVFIKASAETRFLRRLTRDHNERGRSYESIIEQYFKQVIPSFEESIGPSSYFADMIMENDGTSNKALDILTVYLDNLIKQFCQKDNR